MINIWWLISDCISLFRYPLEPPTLVIKFSFTLSIETEKKFNETICNVLVDCRYSIRFFSSMLCFNVGQWSWDNLAHLRCHHWRSEWTWSARQGERLSAMGTGQRESCIWSSFWSNVGESGVTWSFFQMQQRDQKSLQRLADSNLPERRPNEKERVGHNK